MGVAEFHGENRAIRQEQLAKFQTDAKCNILLVSSQAGGMGLNVVAANYLILYEPDWNPANDHQAMARIWRIGQKRECHIYRLATMATIEENKLVRQMDKNVVKEGLFAMHIRNMAFNEADLKDLATYRPSEYTPSSLHSHLKCTQCDNNRRAVRPPAHPYGVEYEGDFRNYWHHYSAKTLSSDSVLKNIWELASFRITMIMEHASRDPRSMVAFTDKQNHNEQRPDNITDCAIKSQTSANTW